MMLVGAGRVMAAILLVAVGLVAGSCGGGTTGAGLAESAAVDRDGADKPSSSTAPSSSLTTTRSSSTTTQPTTSTPGPTTSASTTTTTTATTTTTTTRPEGRLFERISISQTWSILLSTGTYIEPVIESHDQHDFWFEAVTATERYVTPTRASMGRALSSDWSLATCRGVPLSSNRIPIWELAVGDVLCARDVDGALAAIRIDELPAQPGSLVISYLLER